MVIIRSSVAGQQDFDSCVSWEGRAGEMDGAMEECAAPNFQLFCPFYRKFNLFKLKFDHFNVNFHIFSKSAPLRRCRPGRLAPLPLGTPLVGR